MPKRNTSVKGTEKFFLGNPLRDLPGRPRIGLVRAPSGLSLVSFVRVSLN
ncbi:hypothetical protein HMPREF9440_00693 [Sutterella parvirubra YIT 11816]|uniref:Uncharacterized protein n=1 Tax=Sutterella parvirubra YIT 11816 TaxID=762967 RepID=H3KD84_9BURK|nr:hypothetical protein HMPREF9440_00693 [Sutterella parvirubra YIT 11816]